jgi:hypothetical protein
MWRKTRKLAAGCEWNKQGRSRKGDNLDYSDIDQADQDDDASPVTGRSGDEEDEKQVRHNAARVRD